KSVCGTIAASPAADEGEVDVCSVGGAEELPLSFVMKYTATPAIAAAATAAASGMRTLFHERPPAPSRAVGGAGAGAVRGAAGGASAVAPGTVAGAPSSTDACVPAGAGASASVTPAVSPAAPSATVASGDTTVVPTLATGTVRSAGGGVWRSSEAARAAPIRSLH